MRVFKWEQLKEQAALIGYNMYDVQFCALIKGIEDYLGGKKKLSWRDNVDAMREYYYDIIKKWDIRCAGKLFQLFPSIIPKIYHNKPFVADYDKNGDYVVIFT